MQFSLKYLIGHPSYAIPFWKRCIDILAASILILLLSPLFLIIAILIKLESPGPIIYRAKRVGQGYRAFDFYKFRSMRPNADQLLKGLKHLNQYEQQQPAKKTDEVNYEDHILLLQDDGFIGEEAFLHQKAQKEGNTFVKIENDPRITRIGHFIRNTSIDELPQLFNVLLGDMSLVGNRPLPLYEAEKLTQDDWVARFAAPAGITGLWQVTERGKAGVSEDGRKKLDIEYANRYSLWMDLWILWRTLPAAVQKVQV